MLTLFLKLPLYFPLVYKSFLMFIYVVWRGDVICLCCLASVLLTCVRPMIWIWSGIWSRPPHASALLLPDCGIQSGGSSTCAWNSGKESVRRICGVCGGGPESGVCHSHGFCFSGVCRVTESLWGWLICECDARMMDCEICSCSCGCESVCVVRHARSRRTVMENASLSSSSDWESSCLLERTVSRSAVRRSTSYPGYEAHPLRPERPQTVRMQILLVGVNRSQQECRHLL